MSWIASIVEERLARAAANGELATPRLAGKPFTDLDRPRPPGWWADQFVAREKSHDRREDAQRALSVARAGFWRCPDVDAVRGAVAEANDAIAVVNRTLIETDRLTPFAVDDIVDRWRRLHH